MKNIKLKIKPFYCVLTALLFLVACRTPNLPSSSHNENNTQIIEKVETLYVRDSVEVEKKVYVNGDTVYVAKEVTRWRDRFRDRIVHDTTTVVVTDSIPVPVEVPVEVEKEVPYIPGWTWVLLVANCLFIAWKVKKVIGK